MKNFSRLVAFLLLLAPAVLAQEHYTEGPVWRVSLIRVKPTQMDAYLTSLRQSSKPLLEEQKKQGIIMDYKLFLKETKNNPEDWDVCLAIEYKNHAAMDGLAAKGELSSVSQGSGVSPEDVRRVAELANLELTSEEESSMQRDLNAILGHIAQLNELGTNGIPPMAQVGEILGGVQDRQGSPLRADTVRPSLDRALVMAEAPETDGRFFKVPKVIDR